MSADPNALVASYLAAALPGSAAPEAGQLGAWLDEARAAWPQLPPPDQRFAAHLGRHGAGAAPVAVTDLYLAFACALGERAALDALERTCLTDVAKAIWQVDAAEREDVLQRVRMTLLVGDDRDAPGITRYGGRGSLRGWIRSIAVRTAIKASHRAGRGSEIDEESFLELAAATDAPELEPYKQRYRDEFKAAFRAAVDGLTVRHRNILRQYFLDQLTIDEVGAMYRVHRATAARWVHEVRAALIDGVRAKLTETLGHGDVGMRTVIDLVASQLQLSLDRWLDDAEP